MKKGIYEKSRTIGGVLTLIGGYISMIGGPIVFLIGLFFVNDNPVTGGTMIGSGLGGFIGGFFALGEGQLLCRYDEDIASLQSQVARLQAVSQTIQTQQGDLTTMVAKQEEHQKEMQTSYIGTAAEALVKEYKAMPYSDDEARLNAMLEEAKKASVSKKVFLKAVDLMGYTLDQAVIDSIPED